MTFRARLAAAFGVVAIVPLVVIAIGVRHELDRRLTAEDQARVAALAALTRAELTRESTAIGDRLASLTGALADDDRFRLGTLQDVRAQRPYVLDYAGRAMQLTGLSALQIQDSSGRILSSGQFRNDYDRLDPGLPRLLATVPGGAALVNVRTPDGPLLVLARTDSVRIGGRGFALVGGLAVGPVFLARLAADSDLAVRLTLPDPAHDVPPAAGRPVVATLPVPYVAVDTAGTYDVQSAAFTITHSTAHLDALRRSVNRWFLIAMVLTAAAALGVATWLASRMSRPLRDLADRTAHVDFERLDVEFPAGRDDEIGALARLMNAMVRRLRASVGRMRDVERRAAMGDLARQVNHDIKNGLAPIRHVLRHLAQVANDAPQELPRVFAERRSTLDASVAYLDTLARNYARLTPQLDVGPCDANVVARAVAAGTAWSNGASLILDLADDLPPVHADALVLRRILGNLVANAGEALDGRSGTVTLATRPLDGGVCFTVRDTGSGMTRPQLDHAFDDFYTTRAGGTGLGLSIVRRLVTDLHGVLRVDTEPGAGTTVTVTIPAPTAPMPNPTP